MLPVAVATVDDKAAPIVRETAMSERSDIVRFWDRVGFALFAAWMLSLPGGLLLALAGMPGVAVFSLACCGGFVAATVRAERHRDAP